ncbi:hypothetical protein B6D60_08020 [candidate division KSB1 bacterium 4484_87]|nr:MAG: hypothetical protein B6D60_08020 [candidate division KSB1 bacterium 4484_87]
MDELVYFSKFNLLIRATYDGELNAIRYETHRKPTPEEKKSVEVFLISKFAPDTNFHAEPSSSLIFSGVDTVLENDLSEMQFESYVKGLDSRYWELETKVNQLVHGSLRKFYFERLGDKILEFRKQIREENQKKEIVVEKLKHNILELIEA